MSKYKKSIGLATAKLIRQGCSLPSSGKTVFATAKTPLISTNPFKDKFRPDTKTELSTKKKLIATQISGGSNQL